MGGERPPLPAAAVVTAAEMSDATSPRSDLSHPPGGSNHPFPSHLPDELFQWTAPSPFPPKLAGEGVSTLLIVDSL